MQYLKRNSVKIPINRKICQTIISVRVLLEILTTNGKLNKVNNDLKSNTSSSSNSGKNSNDDNDYINDNRIINTSTTTTTNNNNNNNNNNKNNIFKGIVK